VAGGTGITIPEDLPKVLYKCRVFSFSCLCILVYAHGSRRIAAGGVARIDLSHRMAGDEGPYGRLGDCCRADGIQPDLYIDEYVRVRTCITIYIWPCGPLI
jgi:hypothetical protein